MTVFGVNPFFIGTLPYDQIILAADRCIWHVSKVKFESRYASDWVKYGISKKNENNK